MGTGACAVTVAPSVTGIRGTYSFISTYAGTDTPIGAPVRTQARSIATMARTLTTSSTPCSCPPPT
jgi:hypothetical protein